MITGFKALLVEPQGECALRLVNTGRYVCPIMSTAKGNTHVLQSDVPYGSKYLLRRCLGWLWRLQVPSEKVLGSLGVNTTAAISMSIRIILATERCSGSQLHVDC